MSQTKVVIIVDTPGEKQPTETAFYFTNSMRPETMFPVLRRFHSVLEEQSAAEAFFVLTEHKSCVPTQREDPANTSIEWTYEVTYSQFNLERDESDAEPIVIVTHETRGKHTDWLGTPVETFTNNLS